MTWFDRPNPKKARSLLEAITCSIFPLLSIFWSQIHQDSNGTATQPVRTARTTTAKAKQTLDPRLEERCKDGEIGPLFVFGILGMPSTWWDVIIKDFDLGGMLNDHGPIVSVSRNLLKLALPVFSDGTYTLLHKYLPITAKYLTSNVKAAVFFDLHKHPECPETFVYVNGIWSTDRMATSAGRKLEDMLKREVTVVSNPTNSALVDLGKCMFGKLWVEKEWWVPSSSAKLVFQQVLLALQDENKTKVVLIAHSHGTVVASEVLFRLWEAVDNGNLAQMAMKKLEMFNLANTSHWMNQRDGVPYIENICNQHDNVGMLGANAPAHVKHAWNIDISGRMVYPATPRWGHMFQTHYLQHLKKGDYPNSRLHDYFKSDSEQSPGQSSRNLMDERKSWHDHLQTVT